MTRADDAVRESPDAGSARLSVVDLGVTAGRQGGGRRQQLVSTSRGGVVDEEALLHAVRQGRLHSAGLDVFEREPMGTELSPLVAEPHVITLPHIGSATEATRAAMVDLAVDNILDVLAERPAQTPLPGTPAVPGTSAGTAGARA